MSIEYPNLLIGIGASAGGLPPLLEIIDHLSVSYQGANFVAMHRPPDAPNMLLDILRALCASAVNAFDDPQESENHHLVFGHPLC
jgi:chemotaxis response regulator CheB